MSTCRMTGAIEVRNFKVPSSSSLATLFGARMTTEPCATLERLRLSFQSAWGAFIQNSLASSATHWLQQIPTYLSKLLRQLVVINTKCRKQHFVFEIWLGSLQGRTTAGPDQSPNAYMHSWRHQSHAETNLKSLLSFFGCLSGFYKGPITCIILAIYMSVCLSPWQVISQSLISRIAHSSSVE